MKPSRSVKVMVILPNVIGYSGDAINERQLIKALSKRVEVFTYALLPLLRFRMLKDRDSLVQVRSDTKLKFLMPCPDYPYTINILLSIFYGFALSLMATFHKPRLIYVRSAALGLPMILLRRLHKANVIVKIPSIVEDELTNPGGIRIHPIDLLLSKKLLSVIERYVLYNADRISTHSPLLYIELCKRRQSKSPRPFLVIPPGVDLEKIRKILNSTTEKRKNDCFVVGFVGLLEWSQGVDLLVEAVYLLQRNINKRIKLIIAGDGSQRRKIEYMCKELKIDCEITGVVSHENALKIMRNLDVLAVPRRKTAVTESIVPIKVIEAWALGVPVIITRHKIFEHLERSGEMLVISCEPTSESVFHALELAMNDHQLVDLLKTNGLRFVKQFSYDILAERILKIAYEGCDI